MKSFRLLAAAAARRLVTPFVPARTMLPFTVWLQKLGRTCEPELLYIDEFLASTRTAVDIGANIGLYTYELSLRFQRVVAFEINEDLTALIRQYNHGNIELIHSGISSAAGSARFYIPVTGGHAHEGWGSLNRDNLPGAERLIEKDVKLATLDQFALAEVDFIKVDVEGHEVEVLKGAARTIEKWRPIVLVELKKEHVQEVDLLFRPFDYKRCHLEDFNDVPGHRSNHIYVPMERLAFFGISRPVE